MAKLNQSNVDHAHQNRTHGCDPLQGRPMATASEANGYIENLDRTWKAPGKMSVNCNGTRFVCEMVFMYIKGDVSRLRRGTCSDSCRHWRCCEMIIPNWSWLLRQWTGKWVSVAELSKWQCVLVWVCCKSGTWLDQAIWPFRVVGCIGEMLLSYGWW